MVDVHLSRVDFDQGRGLPTYVWQAEWSPQNYDSGIEASGEDLRELVRAVVEDVREWFMPRDLTLEWKIDGDMRLWLTVETHCAGSPLL